MKRLCWKYRPEGRNITQQNTQTLSLKAQFPISFKEDIKWPSQCCILALHIKCLSEEHLTVKDAQGQVHHWGHPLQIMSQTLCYLHTQQTQVSARDFPLVLLVEIAVSVIAHTVWRTWHTLLRGCWLVMEGVQERERERTKISCSLAQNGWHELC